MRALTVALFWLYCVDIIPGKNSRFYWKKPKYYMPWLKGPNVCAVEEVVGSRKRYYSECMAYMPRKICGKPTFLRYHCCTGFERTDSISKGCDGVSPMDNLMETAKHLYLKDFRKHAKRSGISRDLRMDGAYTVFAPHNKAFNTLPKEVHKQMSNKNRKNNLLLYHMVKDRYKSQELINNMELPTLYKDGQTVRINRYSNGILTVNCARVILPNQPATNGILHVTEKVVQPVQKNVMDILLEDDRFGELATALIVTGLGHELKAEGPFTIFAPTDAAFRNAPAGVMERILNDQETLKKLIKYQLMDESICAAAILGPTSLRTQAGQKVNLSCDINDRLTVNGIPTSEVDIVGTNGVIHAIADVLIPDAVKSIGEKLADMEMHQFLEYAQGAGLADIMAGKEQGNFTMFVPSQEAFDKLSAEDLRTLKTQPQAVRKVFNHLVIPGHITTKNMVDNQSFQSRTTDGGIATKLNIQTYHKEFSISGAAITQGNVEVGNGVIHVIDTVLFPPEGTAVDKVKEDARLSTFRSMLQSSGLELTLAGEGTYTVFAPTNDAFDELENTFVEKLMTNSKELKQFMDYHVLSKEIYSGGIRPKLQYRFKTEATEWIKLRKESKEEAIKINGESSLVQTDVRTTNGVIHVVDKVLMCPCVSKLGNQIGNDIIP